MTVAAYYRSSTDLQKNSIEMQRQMALQKSIEVTLMIDEEYIDEAVSARKNTSQQRPSFKRLSDDIAKNRIQDLFVYKRDRLARDAYEYIDIYYQLRNHNVNVIFTAENEHPLYYTPEGELFELIMAGMIQREGEQIVERIKASIYSRFVRGEYVGTLPFGYSYYKEFKKFGQIPDEVVIVQEIFNQLEKGISSADIAKLLNEQGKLHKDRQWVPAMIINIANNPTYMGVRTHGRKSKTPQVQNFSALQIIEKAQWDKVNVAVVQRKAHGISEITQEVDFLLKGLVYCKECEQPLETKISRSGSGFKAKYICSKDKLVFYKDELERQVINLCIEHFKQLLTVDFGNLFARYEKRNSETLNANLSITSTKMERAEKTLLGRVDKLFAESLPPSEVEGQKMKIVKSVADRNHFGRLRDYFETQLEELNDLEPRLKEVTKKLSVKPIFEGRSPEERKLLLEDMVQKVMAQKYVVEVVFKQPFGVIKEATPIEA